MNNFEFIRYKPTPQDPYTLGYAMVRLYGKIVVKFKHVRGKNGVGEFFPSPNFSIQENEEKKYESAFYLDSRSEDEMLDEFVRENVRVSMKSQSANQSQQRQSIGEIVYPHGLTNHQNPKLENIAKQEEIPF